jgi:hypothetical protein
VNSDRSVRLTAAEHNLILHQLETLVTSGEYWDNRAQFEKRLGELIALLKTGDLYWKEKRGAR